MAEKVIPDTWRVVCKQRMAEGETAVNVLHVGVPDNYFLSTANASAVVDALEDAWVTSGLAQDLFNQWRIESWVVTDMRAEPFVQDVVAGTIVGGSADSPLPNQIALTVTWRTPFIGRNYRGRMFLGGFVEAASAGNGPTAGCLARARTLGTAYFQNIDALGAGFDLVVVSKYLNKQERAVPFTAPVRSASVGSVWDSQRRRKIGETV